MLISSRPFGSQVSALREIVCQGVQIDADLLQHIGNRIPALTSNVENPWSPYYRYCTEPINLSKDSVRFWGETLANERKARVPTQAFYRQVRRLFHVRDNGQ